MQGTSRRIARMALAMTVSVVTVGLGTMTAGAWGDVSKRAHLSTNPGIGPKGMVVQLTGKQFLPDQPVSISFVDANGEQPLSSADANDDGAFTAWACIPWNATPGMATIVAQSPRGLALAWTSFRVLGRTARGPSVASGPKRTARVPGLGSGSKRTAWVPGLASGSKRTAKVPGLISQPRHTARTPGLTYPGKGTARVPGLISGLNAAPFSVCVGS